MRTKLLAVVVLAGCGSGDNKQEAEKFTGPLPVAFGDCAGPKVTFVSGPRPLPFTPEEADGVWVAKADPVKPPDPVQPDPVQPDPPRQPGQYRMRQVDPDPQLARQQAIEQARAAGILGTVDGVTGFDDSNIYGGLLGNEPGVMTGGFGYGRAGFGPGGGGTGWGTIGTGRYGTIGRGRASSVPTVAVGQPVAQGDLDKAIIRRYVKRNVNKIQYCYERELLAKPTLAGTVQAQFFIAPTGAVASATAAGMDPEVASCVAGVIKDIDFPRPKGGGGVQVNYPFTFRPADGTGPAPVDPPPAPAAPPPAPPPPATPPPVAKAPDAERTLFRSPGHGMVALAGYKPGAKSPLRAAATELEDCLRKNPRHDGVAVIELAYDGGGSVTGSTVYGIDGEAARTCVADAVKRVNRGGPGPSTQRCPLAFGTASVRSMPTIEITADSVRLDGQQVATPQAVMASNDAAIPELVKEIAAGVKVATTGTAVVAVHDPFAIKPAATTPMKLVTRVITSVLSGGDDLVLLANRGGDWKPLSAFAAPVVPVPFGTGGRWGPVKGKRDPSWVTDSENPVLSLYVTKDHTWLGVSRVNDFVELPPHDLDRLVAALKEKKASAFFVDRTDVEVAGDDAMTYGDVVDAIDAVVKAGFVDWQLTEPARLAARPTL